VKKEMLTHMEMCTHMSGSTKTITSGKERNHALAGGKKGSPRDQGMGAVAAMPQYHNATLPGLCGVGTKGKQRISGIEKNQGIGQIGLNG